MADAPFTTSDYTDLITSEHRGKPKFVSTIEATVDPVANAQAFLKELPAAFDLDDAVGVQLDAVGAWVGVSRTISTCLISVWFSFDTEGLGFDQGIWKGPYDPDKGLYELDDDTYRALIRLKIKVNTWDGTIGTARAAILDFYGTTESFPFILDNQDMSMVVCISGKRPIMVMFSIFAGRYVEFKPAGVTLHTVVPSIEGTPAFGFDTDSDYVAGLDTGSWVVDADSVLCSDDSEYETTLQRFAPAYWTIDLPLTASASLISTSSTGMTLYATLRAKNDLVGLKWQSEDKWSHRGLGYYTSKNYTGCILDFDFVLTGIDGAVSGSESEAAGLTMTVTDDTDTVYYIRLANYLTSGTINAGHIKLDFSGAPVLGGFDPDDASQRVIVPWHRISEFSIGFAPSNFDKDSSDPLDDKIDVVFTVTNLKVSGENTSMIQRLLITGSHQVRMCDGGDDAYPLTPERIVTGLSQTGYSGQYVIYIGASHLHELTWDDTVSSFLVDVSQPVSTPVRAWYQDLFSRLVDAGYDPVISQSYEIFAAMCPEAWQQRDSTGAGARTGWEPPSTLVAPTVTEAMDYLKSVALWMCSALEAAGGSIRYQIGEPWWWDGSYTDGGPCIYDATTMALYTSETGLAVPTPLLTSITEDVGVHGPYLDWLSGKLGDSTLWLRDEVKAVYPDATTYILLFTPQILSPTSEIVTRLNLPVSSWSYPAFDVLQLEDYDWIIDADWENHARTLTAGTDTLGYPLGKIQYFGGFNLLASTASTIWPRITMVINEALEWGIAEVCVWARPQVWRDGWIPRTGQLIGELGDSADAGPDPVEWVFPTGLEMVANTWGDVVLSFAPNQDTSGHSYTIEILDGSTIKRTYTVEDPETVSGRVIVDYPVEDSCPDWGFPPTYLKWQVRVDGSTAKTVLNDNITVNNVGLVEKAIGMAGQSNEDAHFTTLSGAGARKDLVSAGALRRDVANRLGLRSVQVIPVEMAWGSSAADKLADDDPSSGVNYWWDLDGDVAGPRLTQAGTIMADLGVDLAAIVWAQGENDASAMDPSASPRTSSSARYKAATEAIFAGLRSAAGNPSLPIWIQTIGRGWWGNEPDTYEVNGSYFKAVRDVQVAIAAADANVRIGTWVPGVEALSGYVQETDNVGWIHYTSTVYHAAALELGEAIATPLDRTSDRPAWTLLSAPSGFTYALDESSNITVTWDSTSGNVYVVKNINVLTGATISTATITATTDSASFVFLAEDQTPIYGFAGVSVRLDVYQTSGGVSGPTTIYRSSASSDPEAPADLQLLSNSWGDVVISFAPTQEDPTAHTYVVEIMSGSTVKRTYTLTGPTPVAGRVSVDYPVEDSCPDWGFPPSYVTWRVYADTTDHMISGGGAPTLDNAAIVEKAIGIGGQSLALGHFTTLSGAGGRRDLVSAGAMRRDIASALGLRDVQVIPVQMAWGSAAADKLADDDPVDGVNYWWALDSATAGPRLTEAIAIIDALGVPLDYLVWDQGQNDASAIYNANQGDPTGTGRTSTPARYKSATEAIFAAIRTASGNANLPIYFQPIMRAFWSLDEEDTTPTEVIGDIYAEVRSKQLEIATAQTHTYVGTWCPGAETYEGYTPDSGPTPAGGTQYQWLHFNETTYHATAAELAEAIATPLDRIGSPPTWTQTAAPVLTPSLHGYDEIVTWPGTNGDMYQVVNVNVETNGVISVDDVTVSGGVGTWTFTASEQDDAYTYYGVSAYVVVYKVLSGGVHGLSASLTIDPTALSGYPAAPTGLSSARGTGWDVVFSWAAESGATYEVINYRVSDNAVLSTNTVTASGSTASWTFSGAAQISANGAPGGWGSISVKRTYTGTEPGPSTAYSVNMSALSGGPVAPTGLAASWPTQDSWDIAYTWTAVVGRTYRVTNRKVTDSSTLSTVDVTATSTTGSWTFTAAAQTTAYSAHARYVDFDVAEVWDNYPATAATLVHDMWTPALLDSTAPVLWSDAVSGRSIVSASETTHAALFPRTGSAKVVVGPDGSPTTVAANTVAYDYSTGQRRDLREGAATNLLFPSAAPTATFSITVTAQPYTIAFWGAGSAAFSGAHSATVTGSGTNVRKTYTFTPTAGTLNIAFSGVITNVHLETGSVASSYIETTTATVTRTTDVNTWSSTAAALLSGGGVTIAYRGNISSIIATQVFMTTNISNLFYSQTSEPSRVTWTPPGGAQMAFTASYLPGEVGACLAWGNTGAAWSVNGATPGTNTTAATASISSMWFGSISGMQARCVHRIAEIAIWPIKGTSSAVQSQAHVYGA